jgi:molybdate transport system ATP-binding protein
LFGDACVASRDEEVAMKTILLAAGAAALALSAGSALAGTAKNGGPTAVGPKQPIPYAELGAYMKASPKTRVSKDWWSGPTASNDSASTGTSANTSATAPASPSPSLPNDVGGPATSANPPSLGGDQAASPAPATSTAVNPPAATSPGAPASSTPPK